METQTQYHKGSLLEYNIVERKRTRNRYRAETEQNRYMWGTGNEKERKRNIQIPKIHINIYSGKDKQESAQSGVGILLLEKYLQSLVHIEYVDDRILKLTLHLISTYAPDISKPKEDSENFYKELQTVMDKIDSAHKVVIFGDMNARIGNDVILGIKQKYNEAENNDNGELLVDFCARNELRINNTYFPHKPRHKYTF